MSTSILREYLANKLEQQREEHPCFRLKETDNNLFPKGMITFESEAHDSNNQLKSVREIVANSWERGMKHHLMIEGKGGIGKTVTLLNLPNITPSPIPSVYIPLYEVNRDNNTIERYIKNQILDYNDKDGMYGQLMDVANKPWNRGPQLLLLLDGFNEIANELRKEISEDIEQWSKRPGVQIIISSRYDIHQYVALSSTFSKVELQPISEEKVKGHLRNSDIDVPENPVVISLITIPLLLKLYFTTERYSKTRKSSFANYRETKNAGLLIWNYLQSELWRYRNNDEDSKACVIALEFIAPYIAWTMQQRSDFVLKEENFLDRLDEAYKLLKAHFDKDNHKELPKHIKTTVQKTSRQLPECSVIRYLLQEPLSLFNRQERKDSNNDDIVEYRPMHQQFRDALAAMHLINSSYFSGDSLPVEWESSVEYYIMQFVADLIGEDEANHLWEQNRNRTPAIENATRNQLRLQELLHNNDFTHLDFSGLDLRNISLYPYRNSKATLKLPISPEKMNKTKLSTKTFSPIGNKGGINTIAVTPDGKRIVSGSDDHIIRVWDLETGAAIGKPIEGHEDCINAIAMTPDGNRIVSGSDDHTIRVWDMETGVAIGKPIEGHKDRVEAVAVTPDGKRIVSGSQDRTIRIWDLETGAALGRPIKGHKNSVYAIAVTPNGKRIVSGSGDHTIRMWDAETGAATGRPIEGHNNMVTTIAATPNGKCIVSGSDDHTVRVWDAETGAAIGRPIEGHNRWVTAVAVTPDGKHIVSGSDDGTIGITDIETREFKRIKAHPLSFVGLDFSLAQISDAELKETLRQNGAKV